MTVRTLSKTRLAREQAVFLALIREVRREAGLRQRDVATRMGVPQSFVSKYESGERRLDIVELRALCDALDLPLSNLVDRLEKKIADDAP